jgi:two-component system sensor histidine kinase ChvG
MLKTWFARARAAWHHSRIGWRLLAFNLLTLFLPVAGILYLDVYEDQLLDAQERGMVEQGRLVAAALAGSETLSVDMSRALLARFGQQGDARVRVYDAAGALVADSVRPPSGRSPEVADSVVLTEGASVKEDTRARVLYRLGAWLAATWRAAEDWPRRFAEYAPSLREREASAVPPEVRTALEGRYGAASRETAGQRSLTLVSAVPIRSGDRVIGVVAVSQTTFRILQAIYDVRLRIFEIVIASAAAAVLLSLAVTATVVRPIGRLRKEALALTNRQRRFQGFSGIHRHDEIGDLARALDDQTRRLDAHIRLLEEFAADVSHEFKNPLASIRSAAEMLAHAERDSDRERFSSMLVRDVGRLERLVSGVRELAVIDAQLADEPMQTVDLVQLLRQVSEGMQLTGGRVEFHASHASVLARGSADRLAQVFENLLQNARSFTADGSAIEVSVEPVPPDCRVRVLDRGPGIPPAHLERVFERFFTYRPNQRAEERKHTGLGLAIARTIVQGYGGTITASNRDGGGACFEVCLPLASQGHGVARDLSPAIHARLKPRATGPANGREAKASRYKMAGDDQRL